MKLIRRFWNWICNIKTSTVVVFFSFILMIAFTVAVLIISNNSGVVPDALIYCVFFMLIIALLISGTIAVKKIKAGEIELEFRDKKNEDTGEEVNEEDDII